MTGQGARLARRIAARAALMREGAARPEFVLFVVVAALTPTGFLPGHRGRRRRRCGRHRGRRGRRRRQRRRRRPWRRVRIVVVEAADALAAITRRLPVVDSEHLAVLAGSIAHLVAAPPAAGFPWAILSIARFYGAASAGILVVATLAFVCVAAAGTFIVVLVVDPALSLAGGAGTGARFGVWPVPAFFEEAKPATARALCR